MIFNYIIKCLKNLLFNLILGLKYKIFYYIIKMPKKSSKMLNNLMSENVLTCILLVIVLGLLIYTVMIYRENFESLEPTGTTAKFVMFYADWCPHCQTTKPEFAKLKEELEANNNKINNVEVEVVMVDCVADPETAKD